MKKFIFIFTVILFQSGCAMPLKTEAVRAAADQSKFEGLDKNAQFSISLPASHSGPYASVDQLNFNIAAGKYKGKNASALIGKSRKTDAWEVLMIMVNKNEKWITLPESTQTPPQL